MIENGCETCKGQPVPGILSHNLSAEFPPEYPTIERCDTCERFGSDDVARDVYEVIRWGRTVVDYLWQSDRDDDADPAAGSLRALDVSLGDLLDDRSVVA